MQVSVSMKEMQTLLGEAHSANYGLRKAIESQEEVIKALHEKLKEQHEALKQATDSNKEA